MRAPGRPKGLIAVLGWLPVPIALVATVLLDRRHAHIGRPDLTVLHANNLGVIAGMASAATVGAILVLRRPAHPVGWLFLALGDLIALDGVASGYAAYGAVARPGSLPAATVVAVLDDAVFWLWMALLALILHLTPSGSPLSLRWKRVAQATVVSAVASYAVGLLVPRHLNGRFAGIANPLAIRAAGSALAPVGALLGYATGMGLVLAAISLVVRFRRATGLERQQLLWMAVGAVPFGLFVAAAFVASSYQSDAGVNIASGGFLAVLPVAAGLSVGRYHLYDVDAVLSRAVTYLLSSALLAASFVAAVFVIGQTVGGWTGRSRVADVLGTMAAIAVTAPAHRHIQARVDRRFRRRRFEALRVVRQFVAAPEPGVDAQDVLRSSLGDPTVSVAFWIDSRQNWVTSDGRAAQPGTNDVLVQRHGRPVASIGFDHGVSEKWLVEAAALEARTELENAGLRADLAQRLVEVRESRSRLIATQETERTKLERDLHDGAQQRLLAAALNLRAAVERTGTTHLRDAAEGGIEEIQRAIVELRELANGIQPSALRAGGLLAVIDELVARTPVLMRLSVPDVRYPSAVEGAAWFVVAEAVTNAVKHARPTSICITISQTASDLTVAVADDGGGGADPAGSGLRGLADRVESIGGSLLVQSDVRGSCIQARLPCGS